MSAAQNKNMERKATGDDSKSRTAAKSDLGKDERTSPAGGEPAATEVSDPNTSTVDERNDAPGFVPEERLTTEAVIQRRTSTIDGGPEWPADGRYHKVFNVQAPRTSTPGPDQEPDWNAPEHEAMHEANKVAVLQEAMMRGLHPRGAATFVGPLDGGLEYAVEVVPATSDAETAAATYTPSAALADQGGSTLPEFNDGQDERK